MLSAYFTLILVILYYISDQRNTENLVDRRLIDMIKPKAWKERSKTASEIWTAAIESSVLMFSDTQVITGMAILLCGYTQLATGLSSYHWEVVVGLAWFSSLTHLATLTSLRDYFRDRPTMAFCRAGFMGVVLILLAVSFGTTGYVPQFRSSESLSWPAECLFSPASMSKVGFSDTEMYLDLEARPRFNITWIVLSIALLVISYLTRIVRIFNRPAGLARRWLRVIPRGTMRGWYSYTVKKLEGEPGRPMRAFWDAIVFLLALTYIISKAVYDIGESMLWEVC